MAGELMKGWATVDYPFWDPRSSRYTEEAAKKHHRNQRRRQLRYERNRKDDKTDKR